MKEEKRKTKTSTAVKKRYNQKAYDVIRAHIPKDMAEAFKAKCIVRNVSQAQVIKEAIQKFLSE